MRKVDAFLRDQAMSVVTEHCRILDFGGRSTRKQFWLHIGSVLFVTVILIVIAFAIRASNMFAAIPLLWVITTIPTPLIRRIRDAGYRPSILLLLVLFACLASGAWFMWVLIAAAGMNPGVYLNIASKALTGMAGGVLAHIIWITLERRSSN
ncbi:DUF805 domain-containing protein [Sulfitobacter sp. R18_1]|nr:DUF805 domain-containing protein [Sulfitobacter sp. R18_1]